MSGTERRPELLDRALSAEHRVAWTERMAAETRMVAPGTESVLIFRIGAEWLALSAVIIHTITKPSAMHALPRRREGVDLALANIDGELIVVVALSGLLGVSADRDSGRAKQRLVIVDAPGGRLAFHVQDIGGIHRYRRDEIREAPATLSHAATHYTTGILPWNGETVARLDDALVLQAMVRALS